MSFGINCAHVVDELRGPRPQGTSLGGRRPAVGTLPCSPAVSQATPVTGGGR